MKTNTSICAGEARVRVRQISKGHYTCVFCWVFLWVG